MRSGAKTFVCLGTALLITVLAAAISIPVQSGQSEAPAAFFFPYAFLAAYLRGGRMDALFFTLGLLQFFIYSAFFAWAWVWGDDLRRLWVRIGGLHLLFGVGCALLYSIR